MVPAILSCISGHDNMVGNACLTGDKSDVPKSAREFKCSVHLVWVEDFHVSFHIKLKELTVQMLKQYETTYSAILAIIIL